MLPSVVEYEYEELRTTVDEVGCLYFMPVRPRHNISTLFKWLEAWSVYELILVAHSISVFNEMAAYRIFVISLFSKFRLPFVLTYDMQHRQLLGAYRSFKFVTPNNHLNVTIFDSAARCASTEQATADCPFWPLGRLGTCPGQLESRGKGQVTDSLVIDSVEIAQPVSCATNSKRARTKQVVIAQEIMTVWGVEDWIVPKFAAGSGTKH